MKFKRMNGLFSRDRNELNSKEGRKGQERKKEKKEVAIYLRNSCSLYLLLFPVCDLPFFFTSVFLLQSFFLLPLSVLVVFLRFIIIFGIVSLIFFE
jgi:hypothetical protein